MKAIKFILLFLLIIMAAPVFSVILLSFQHNGHDVLRWYKEILTDAGFVDSLRLSVFVSSCVALLTLILSFIAALSWFDGKQMLLVSLVVCMLGLLPPDVVALGINALARFLGFYSCNLFFLMLGLMLYCLPYTVLILWARFYFIPRSLITAARDLGLSRFSIVVRIILPLSGSALLSGGLLSFLLSFNEYPRTYYLSGSFQLLSEYLNGKLGSGANPSIYAGGSITILVTVGIVLLLGLYYYWANKRSGGWADISTK